MGAEVEMRKDTVWLHKVDKQLEDIDILIDKDSIWYRRMNDILKTALEYWQGQVQVSTSDFGHNLDLLAVLRGTENLLVDLIEKPEIVEEKVKKITNIWIEYFKEEVSEIRKVNKGIASYAPLFSENLMSMIYCDFSAFISPDMFDRFVMPCMYQLCDFIDYSFYHLDGPDALRHLDSLLSIEKLNGIQWVPGAGQKPHEYWLEVIGKIKNAGKLCQLNGVSPEGAIEITKKLGGRGFCYVVSSVDFTDETQALDFLNGLERLPNFCR
jgi:hypothetical protein